jgi:hypothetical protein
MLIAEQEQPEQEANEKHRHGRYEEKELIEFAHGTSQKHRSRNRRYNLDGAPDYAFRHWRNMIIEKHQILLLLFVRLRR